MKTLDAGPLVDDAHVTFRVDDPHGDVVRVRLVQELLRPRVGPEFARVDARWQLRLPRPDVHRIEYQLELTRADGTTEVVCDPANPRRAPGPFGDKSVVEMPGYRPPAWVARRPAATGDVVALDVPSATLRATLRVELWSSHGTRPADRLPLLVAHDGPEYARLSSLTHLLDVQAADGALPPMRAALVPPVERDQDYSASAAYARALTHEILPAVTAEAPVPRGRAMRVGMGASLGALAMLHAHRGAPAAFGGLFLQSGSFFQPRLDGHESGFARFRRVTRFVGRVLAAEGWAHPVPVAMTCGTIEENLANNRAMRDALARQGYDVELHEVRDGHNWVAWRDAFEPPLVRLLQRTWA